MSDELGDSQQLFVGWPAGPKRERYTLQIATSSDGARGLGQQTSIEGAALNLQEFLKLLRARWVSVAVTTLVAVLGAVVDTKSLVEA
jgi:hypothetical protein